MNKTKIIVIDDETNIRETITDILTFQGYEVYAASGGKMGLQLILKEQPDLVLCDIMMPDMDGYEVLTRIRGEEHLKSLPFLLISAKNDSESIRTGMNLGSDDYLSKPFKSSELVTAIETKLRRFREFKDSLHQEINQLQEQFCFYGFQELNKPVNSILGLVHFLKEYDQQLQNNERLLFFDRIEQSTHHLCRSYSNLILYLRVTTNHPIYSSTKDQNCSTLDCKNNTLNKLKIAHPNIHPEFKLEMARPAISCEALEFIMYEIVDNSIKHSENNKPPYIEGKINIENAVYELKFHDFGHGLSPEKVSKILKNSKFDRSLSNEPGWGLGLFLTRHLLKQFNASFEFKSTVGLGTITEIAIPLE